MLNQWFDYDNYILCLPSGWFAHQRSADQLHSSQLANLASPRFHGGIHHPYCQGLQGKPGDSLLFPAGVWRMEEVKRKLAHLQDKVLQRCWCNGVMLHYICVSVWLVKVWYQMFFAVSLCFSFICIAVFPPSRFGYFNLKGGKGVLCGHDASQDYFQLRWYTGWPLHSDGEASNIKAFMLTWASNQRSIWDEFMMFK